MVQKRVHIIEDDADTRTALREFLERSGYLTAEAADGLGGLAQAESWHPHAILLDVRMPDLDGYEVCRRLKANPTTKPIPVIVVTAVVDSPVSRLAYEAGAAACVLKPFRLEALVTVIQTTIGARQDGPVSQRYRCAIHRLPGHRSSRRGRERAPRGR